MRIQRQGRNAHAGAHDRNLFALKQAGVSQHSTDIIEQYRILQIMLSDILRAERTMQLSIKITMAFIITAERGKYKTARFLPIDISRQNRTIK